MANEKTGLHSPLCGNSATKWDNPNSWLEVIIDKGRNREMERSFDFWNGKKRECQNGQVRRFEVSEILATKCTHEWYERLVKGKPKGMLTLLYKLQTNTFSYKCYFRPICNGPKVQNSSFIFHSVISGFSAEIVLWSTDKYTITNIPVWCLHLLLD